MHNNFIKYFYILIFTVILINSGELHAQTVANNETVNESSKNIEVGKSNSTKEDMFNKIGASTPSKSDFYSSLKSAFVFLLVLGSIAGLLKYKNFQSPSIKSKNKVLKIIEELPLNSNNSLLLVNAGNERLLLSKNLNSVSLIKSLKTNSTLDTHDSHSLAEEIQVKTNKSGYNPDAKKLKNNFSKELSI